MTDVEHFAQIYSVADSATLLGLEPLLRAEIELAKDRMQSVGSSSESLADESASLAESRAETLLKLARREDLTEEMASEFREALDQLVSMHSANVSRQIKNNDEIRYALFNHLVELVNRRRAIFAVLRDRNLIPESPY